MIDPHARGDQLDAFVYAMRTIAPQAIGAADAFRRFAEAIEEIDRGEARLDPRLRSFHTSNGVEVAEEVFEQLRPEVLRSLKYERRWEKAQEVREAQPSSSWEKWLKHSMGRQNAGRLRRR